MLEAKDIEDLAARLSAVIPPAFKGLRRELEDNFRAVLRANLEKWDLVSRERFDAQAEVLARARTKLAKLEARLAKLEAAAGDPAKDSHAQAAATLKSEGRERPSDL